MKSIITTTILLWSCLAIANDPITVTSNPEKAIVFLNGAQLFHSKTISLPAGTSEVIFEGIPQSIDANSIQAGGKGDFTVLDVQYRLFYPEPVAAQELPGDVQKRIKAIQDSLVEANFIMEDISNQQQVIAVQKDMLMNNKMLITNGGTDSLQLLQQSVEYYNKKLNEIFAEALRLEKKMYALNLDIAKKNQRLNDLQNYWAQQNAKITGKGPVSQIIVSVVAEFATSVRVDLNYLTYSAGWYPTYDIRASDIGQPVQLSYKANIWQNTGIDWKDVHLTCSTGNPTMGNTLPQLTTWYVGYYQYYYGRDYNTDAAGAAPAARAEMDMNETITGLASKSTMDDKKDATNASQFTQHTQTIANVEFEINLDYTIPSDGKGHLVSLETKTLPSDYNYLIVPKIEQSAFLIARITEWESVNLLPGNANIYFNNTYVGKTYLDPLTLNDTLSISMGRDKSIDVKRTQVADKSFDRPIGVNNKKTMAFEINVRNGKAISADVIVMDQIPISQDDDIKVELTDSGKGELNADTGFITWREKLKSKDSKVYKLEFDITYPKNQTLSLN